jgi:tRNA(adenine34) deaminase
VSAAFTAFDEAMMRRALQEARAAEEAGEVPVGAVVARGGDILSASGNRTLRDADATAHAEVLAIRDANALLGTWRLDACTLYVTLEPCAMCAGAIVLARVARVVFGAWDDKAGMAGSVADLLRHPRLNHRPEVAAGLLGADCGLVLTDFFKRRRAAGDADAAG